MICYLDIYNVSKYNSLYSNNNQMIRVAINEFTTLYYELNSK